jgi:DNA repair exonuclease SbcCD nuclease subunit
MSAKFLHTADWQLGKPFAGIGDPQKRALVQQQRLDAIHRLGTVAKDHQAGFILVAGDLFDSSSVGKSTVAAACSAIGSLEIPVIVIPGNHDHGGPGSIWHQPYFQRETAHLSPNLKVLLTPEPVELPTAVIFPCPLLRRAETVDPSTWIRSLALANDAFAGKPRIVLAHGSTQGFGSSGDEDDGDSGPSNRLDLSRIPADQFDYIALGDWHGTKRVSDKAWYAGTPELDRFPKGDSNEPGHCLVVACGRGTAASVQTIRTAKIGWHELAFDFVDDSDLGGLQARLDELLGKRAQEDLLRLELSGTLGLSAFNQLQHLVESIEARLLRLKLANRTVISPSAAEINMLTQRTADPLISRVAVQLVARANGEGEDAEIARLALRELHLACKQT